MLKKIIIISFLFLTIFANSQDVGIEIFGSGFTEPVNIQNAGDDRLFIVEKDGVIKILDVSGNTNSTPFLDINPIVGSIGGEQGLLGLAFDPDYVSNGFFYVNYTNNSGNTVISRYSVSVIPDIADSSSGQILLTINQPFSNHNGGCILFGPDGYLYIGMGDGGSANDPQDNAQDGNSLLGKILRIEVGAASTYSIPADNPFIGDSSVDDEIWSIGVRNPWRFSFDRTNGDLWIGDVGQGDIEEIDHTTSASGGGSGLNFGWRCYEGNNSFNTTGCGDISNYTFPVAEYSHTGDGAFKCSITGGYVYRGSQFTDFNGLYFFADICSSEIGTVDPNNGYQITYNNGFTGQFSSFGEDNLGELYIANLSDGIIYKIVDETLSIDNELLSNDISIFPNPTEGNAFINSENYSIENIRVYDILGSEILDKEINNLSNYQLVTQGLQQGVYFVRIQLSNAKSIVKKLIIK